MAKRQSALLLISTVALLLPGCSDEATRSDRGVGSDARTRDGAGGTRKDGGTSNPRDARVVRDVGAQSDAYSSAGPLTGNACENETACPGGCLSAQAYGFPGGYCAAQCYGNPLLCGKESHCGVAVQNFAFCLRNCTGDTDCRQAAGYACFDSDGDAVKECMPVGTGSGAVGAPCATTADCAGGQRAICGTATNGGFTAGYCSIALCTAAPQDTCPTGSHCVDHSVPGRRPGCGKDCSSNSDCRTDGYACYDADHDGKKECAAAATGSAAIGAACSGTSQCGGGPFAFCFLLWSGGYCTQDCTPSFGEACDEGSNCVDLGGTRRCLAACTASCRTGYRCTDLDGDQKKECVLN